MIGCEKCDGWFHPACVGITTKDAKELPDDWSCPPCNGDEVKPPPAKKARVYVEDEGSESFNEEDEESDEETGSEEDSDGAAGGNSEDDE